MGIIIPVPAQKGVGAHAALTGQRDPYEAFWSPMRLRQGARQRRAGASPVAGRVLKQEIFQGEDDHTARNRRSLLRLTSEKGPHPIVAALSSALRASKDLPGSNSGFILRLMEVQELHAPARWTTRTPAKEQQDETQQGTGRFALGGMKTPRANSSAGQREPQQSPEQTKRPHASTKHANHATAERLPHASGNTVPGGGERDRSPTPPQSRPAGVRSSLTETPVPYQYLD